MIFLHVWTVTSPARPRKTAALA